MTISFSAKSSRDSRSDLAFEWLEARIRDTQDYELVSETGVYRGAIQALAPEQCQRLLRTLGPGHLASQLVSPLVGDSAELYKSLVSLENLRKCHLEPLSSETLGERWEIFAKLAVEAGHDPEAVAERLIWPAYSRSGFGIDQWSEWTARFQSLLERAQGRLREVAVHGLEIAEHELAEAEGRKRHFERTGQF